MASNQNIELSLLLGISRQIPRFRGGSRIARAIKKFYVRKRRKRVDVEVLGFKMDLDPTEYVDGRLLFGPQFYDYKEFRVMGDLLNHGDVFLDAGANIGIYTLIASRLVGSAGKVISVEASSFNANCLESHVAMNGIQNVECCRVGLSDRVEVLELACSDWGNRSGNSFHKKSSITEKVKCLPLGTLLENLGVDRVNAAKFDIEGCEYSVLREWFISLDRANYPKFIIVEHNESLSDQSSGDVRDLLRTHGYRVSWIADQNYLALLD